jgi:protein-S-isoprenylcysteine O-methyltransferase Ste14
MIKRVIAFSYGVVCYAIFLATLLYAIGFLANFGVPKSIDGVPEGSGVEAVLVDAALLAAFALQHSIMARRWFKRAWTRVIPEPVERSTYVLFSSLALLLLFWQWRPLGGEVWNAGSGVLSTLLTLGFGLGLAIVLLSTFLINHFDLFGLRQVWLYLRAVPYTPLRFRTPFFYRHVRHPLYVGWLLTFWCAPVMTAAHLFFAGMTTAYILVAIQLEEKDLVAMHGSDYERYREDVPMLIPSPRPARRTIAAGR